MRPRTGFWLPFALAAAAPAQSLEVSTFAPSGAAMWAPSQQGALFQNGDLLLPVGLQLTAPWASASFRANLTPIAREHVVGVAYVLEADVSLTYRMGASVRTDDGTRLAPHAFSIAFLGEPDEDRVGMLRVAVSSEGHSFGGAASGTNWVDLDGDRVADVTLPTPVELGGASRTWVRVMPYTLRAGRSRSFTLWAQAAVSASFAMNSAFVHTNAELTFATKEAATSFEFGTACKADITGAYETHALDQFPAPSLRRTVDLALAGAGPNAPVLLVIGVDRITVPLPGTACMLYTTPVLAVPTVADATGRARLGFDVPEGASGPMSFQYLAGGAGSLVATEGLVLNVE